MNPAEARRQVLDRRRQQRLQRRRRRPRVHTMSVEDWAPLAMIGIVIVAAVVLFFRTTASSVQSWDHMVDSATRGGITVLVVAVVAAVIAIVIVVRRKS